MKAVLLFFSLLAFCVLNLNAQIPDLPLSFTNEEIARFKQTVEVHCMSYGEDAHLTQAYANRHGGANIIGFGNELNVNILKDASCYNLEDGYLYFYIIEHPDIHDISIIYKEFHLSEESYLFVYNEYADKEKIDIALRNFDNGYVYQTKLEGDYLGSRIVVELFEPKKDTPSDSKLILAETFRHLY